MFHRILIALALAVVAYVIYVLATRTKRDPFVPAPAPSIEQQARVEPPRVVAPSGPNPPNAASSLEREAPPDVTARDPHDDANSSQNLQDNLRHPERSFSPGLKPSDTNTAVMSGVASTTSGNTSQAIQVFAPEMAQNGGEFMQGIAANDTLSDKEYAEF
jgi:hypothetical protein